jgi:hypothetical protein
MPFIVACPVISFLRRCAGTKKHGERAAEKGDKLASMHGASPGTRCCTTVLSKINVPERMWSFSKASAHAYPVTRSTGPTPSSLACIFRHIHKVQTPARRLRRRRWFSWSGRRASPSSPWCSSRLSEECAGDERRWHCGGVPWQAKGWAAICAARENAQNGHSAGLDLLTAILAEFRRAVAAEQRYEHLERAAATVYCQLIFRDSLSTNSIPLKGPSSRAGAIPMTLLGARIAARPCLQGNRPRFPRPPRTDLAPSSLGIELVQKG